MKKKIISLFLCVCIICSVVIIPAAAAEANSSYSASEIEEFVEQGTSLGFDELIDVEEYASKAMTAGYDSLSILRVGVPEITFFEEGIEDSNPFYRYTIPVYLYNPELLVFEYVSENNENNLHVVYRPSVEEDFVSGVIVPLNMSEGEYQISDMFIEGHLIGAFSLEEGADYISADKVEFHFEKLIYNATKQDGSELWYQELQINKAIELVDIDHRIQYTRARTDFETMFGMTKTEIWEKFPYNPYAADKFQVAHLYEKGYGSSNYELYLYIYNPSCRNIDDSDIRLYLNFGWNEYYYRHYAEIIDVDTTLIKCRIKLDGPWGPLSSSVVRDYNISQLGIKSSFSEGSEYEYNTYDCFAHFEYSADNLNYYTKCQYIYEGKITADCDYAGGSLSLELPEYVQVELPDSDVELTKKSTGFYSFSGADDGDINLKYRLISDYPLVANGFYYVIKPNSLLSGFSPIYGFSNVETFDYKERSKIETFTLGDDEVGEGDLYVRSSTGEILELTVTPTYFNLGHSSKGADYYATLVSLGFALPMDLLQIDDEDPYNDRYISHVDYVYDMYYVYTLVSDFPYMPSVYGIEYKDGYISVNPNDPFGEQSDFNFSAKWFSEEDWETLCRMFDSFSPEELFAIAASDVILGHVPPFSESEDYKEYLSETNVIENFFFFYEEIIEDGELIADDKLFLDMFSNYYDDKYGIGLFNAIKESMPEASEEEVQIAYDTLVDFLQYFSHHEKRLTFADTFELAGYDQADFWTVCDDLGFWNAICHSWNGMTDEWKSFENIRAFEIITPDSLQSIRNMSLSDFSTTYFIDSLEAQEMKDEIIEVLAKGEAYVLMRYDVYDVQSKEAIFVYQDGADGEYHVSIEEGYSAFINKQRAYKDLEILEIGLTNNQNTVIKTVSMEPIDFTGPVIAPDPPTADDIKDPIDVIIGGLGGVKDSDAGQSVFTYLSVIAVAALAVGIVWVVIKLRGSKTVVNIPSSFVEAPPAPKFKAKPKKSSHRQYKKTKPKKRE